MSQYGTLTFVPPVIAHRGARIRAPENTMAAFKAAHEDGAVWIETDVKLTSDGVPILMHDDLLDRTTDAKGSVAEMSWADMQHVDAGSWFSSSFKGTRVPLLSELLSFIRGTNMRLNLEIKPCPGRTRVTTMVALIEVAKLLPHPGSAPLISSFDTEALMIAAQLHPSLPRGLLLNEWREDWQELVHKTRATTINLNANILTPERIAELLKADMPILSYTVNDPSKAKLLLKQGVRAVFSDDPRGVLSALS